MTKSEAAKTYRVQATTKSNRGKEIDTYPFIPASMIDAVKAEIRADAQRGETVTITVREM